MSIEGFIEYGTLGALDLSLSPEQVARLDAVSEIPPEVPHQQIKENASRLAGGQLDCFDSPPVPVA